MKITALNTLDYKITVDAKVIEKFRYILNSKYMLEFTSLHHCTRNGNHFHISDIFFPKQTNSAALTDFESDDIMELITEGADITKLCGHMH